MIDREREADDLAKAEADIVAGERRVSELVMRIDELRDAGRDTATAERLLGALEESIQAWRAHRDEILRLIHDIEKGRA